MGRKLGIRLGLRRRPRRGPRAERRRITGSLPLAQDASASAGGQSSGEGGRHPRAPSGRAARAPPPGRDLSAPRAARPRGAAGPRAGPALARPQEARPRDRTLGGAGREARGPGRSLLGRARLRCLPAARGSSLTRFCGRGPGRSRAKLAEGSATQPFPLDCSGHSFHGTRTCQTRSGVCRSRPVWSWPPQIPALPEKRRRPLLLSRAHLQAGPCQHKRRALPESAPLVLDKTPSPGTLEGTPLLLELQKLPGLANTDLSALNPNIQVRATGAAMSPEDSWREVGLNSSALKSGISSCIPWRMGVLCRSDKVTPMPHLWSRRSRASSLSADHHVALPAFIA
ncbi:putative hydro-lyase KRH_21160 [Cervus canadensis]|uniref:putative hydro-lyase KRH_21160 n=1 Tax=Cervus canadensis TaxID=1574408 RepID=UPI001C9E87F8|nr:putative hydro-lyase KRH_21160 [Cervus canadensis]